MKPNKNILIIAGSAIATIGTAFLLYKQFNFVARIISQARKFVGERELEPNKGFVNQTFQKLMVNLGNWKPGYEWCACFVRMVWMLVLTGNKKVLANKLLSPSSQLTYENFEKDKSGLFSVSQTPKPGSITIWKSYSQPGKGHAGLFIQKLGGRYIFIEGNKGQKVSLTSYSENQMINYSSTMKLRGFIHVK